MFKQSIPKKHALLSGCPIAHALDVIGDRWTLLILREIALENRHEFGEFIKIPEKIATNILADRLKKLSQAGVIDSISDPHHKKKRLHYLTEKGIQLIPVMIEIMRWSIDNLPDLPGDPDITAFRKDPEAVAVAAKTAVMKWNKEHLQ